MSRDYQSTNVETCVCGAHFAIQVSHKVIFHVTAQVVRVNWKISLASCFITYCVAHKIENVDNQQEDKGNHVKSSDEFSSCFELNTSEKLLHDLENKLVYELPE
jgi:hypothetical protein